jgi:V8-like Glu-specific endopeptidase
MRMGLPDNWRFDVLPLCRVPISRIAVRRRCWSAFHAGRKIAALLVFLSLANAVAARDPRQPTLLPEAEQAAWNAVGRVNVVGHNRRSMCSGTLVAPDLVLTAAHCLVTANGRAVGARNVHFVAGWRQGAFVAHRAVSEVTLHPQYDATFPPLAERAPYDLAFLVLENPIPQEVVAPLPLSELPDPAGPLAVVGYRRDRAHAPSRQTGCRVTWRGSGSIGTDCPVIEGASGAPMLWNGPDGWRVVALVGASVPGNQETRSLSALVPLGPTDVPEAN